MGRAEADRGLEIRRHPHAQRGEPVAGAARGGVSVSCCCGLRGPLKSHAMRKFCRTR